VGLVASPRRELGAGRLDAGASLLLPARQSSTPRSPGSPLAGHAIEVNCCCLKPHPYSKFICCAVLCLFYAGDGPAEFSLSTPGPVGHKCALLSMLRRQPSQEGQQLPPGVARG